LAELSLKLARTAARKSGCGEKRKEITQQHATLKLTDSTEYQLMMHLSFLILLARPE